MISSFFSTDTITRLRAPLVNDQGALVPDWSDDNYIAKLVIDDVDIQEGTGQMNTDDRNASMTAKTVFITRRVDVLPTDRLRLSTGDYVLVMEPQVYVASTGITTVLQLQRWEDQIG